ncbi:MAG: FxsA family protein [Pseudonocardiales bacterium]|nr:FxsA family protein [Pseudonocardiales bacterium]
MECAPHSAHLVRGPTEIRGTHDPRDPPIREEVPAIPSLILALVAAAIIELTVLIVVGHAIGVPATIGLLILTSLLGTALLRREGTRTLGAFVEALRTHRLPHRELLDGILIVAAGALVVLPGFMSDVLGLLLLLPPTRALARRRILRSAARRAAVRFAPGAVVEGEVLDEPAPRSARGELR